MNDPSGGDPAGAVQQQPGSSFGQIDLITGDVTPESDAAARFQGNDSCSAPGPARCSQFPSFKGEPLKAGVPRDMPYGFGSISMVAVSPITRRISGGM
jgi:hypothetical protein